MKKLLIIMAFAPIGILAQQPSYVADEITLAQDTTLGKPESIYDYFWFSEESQSRRKGLHRKTTIVNGIVFNICAPPSYILNNTGLTDCVLVAKVAKGTAKIELKNE